ncbi:hypothetical protein Hanom_Chr11g01064561 [Helianthus anomalus]
MVPRYKDVPSIELPERALVAIGMSLHWKADRHDKAVYVEDDKIVALYVVAYKRGNGKMTTVQKGANEDPWYHQIIKNFALPKDEELAAQPSTGVGELTNLGIGPEKKKKHAPAVTVAPKKADAPKAKVAKEEKKGTRLFPKTLCDYVVVSDTLEGLTPVAVKKPQPEPQDTADIPPSNPDEPIDLDSSPQPLVRTKAVKRKPESEAAAQPAKKIIRKRISKKEKLVPSVHVESSSAFNDDLPPSPPHASIREQLEGTRAMESEVKKTVEVEMSAEVESEAEKVVETEAADVGATKPKSPVVMVHSPESGRPIFGEDPVITIPSPVTTYVPPKDNLEENLADVDQGFFAHDEEDSPIRPEETLGDYYYRSFLEKRASEIHAPVWKLKQGDIFLTGKCAETERSHDQTYHSYLKETASSTSTTHRIVREWHSMHMEWNAFETSKKEVVEEMEKVALLRSKLEADQAKFENERKTEEWSAAGWKRKVESDAALLSEERKRWREICDKDNSEKMVLWNNINNLKAEIERLKKEKAEAEVARDEARSHRERNEQREEQTKAELESAKKDLQFERVGKAETSRRLAETEEKLENSETAGVTVESLVEPLKNDMLRMRHHGIINVSVLQIRSSTPSNLIRLLPI